MVKKSDWMNYSVYTVEDFVTDEFFIHWVKNPTEESNAFWNAWLSKNPDKEPLVREARQIILMLNFKETQAPQGKFLEIWERISVIDDRKVCDNFGSASRESLFGSLRRWQNLAAVLLLVAVTLAYVVLHDRNAIVVQTAFGESRTLFLPDSTKVTLNANSSLRYDLDFGDANREVWLDGEAFFAVTHKMDHQNFIVRTDELEVEVLGTRFNVSTRRGKSMVVLEEGEVKLAIPQDDQDFELVMKPGELVEVSGETHKIEKKPVDVSHYSSWRMNKLVFVGTTLAEIGQLLQDNYGLNVRFGNENLRDLRFTGSASADDLHELLEKLNKVFGLNIQKQGNELIFQYK